MAIDAKVDGILREALDGQSITKMDAEFLLSFSESSLEASLTRSIGGPSVFLVETGEGRTPRGTREDWLSGFFGPQLAPSQVKLRRGHFRKANLICCPSSCSEATGLFGEETSQ